MWPNLPLKERIFKSFGAKHSYTCTSTERPTKYKTYSCEKLQRALHAVASSDISVRRAAEEYGIPRSTLWDHASGRVTGLRSGPPTYLTEEEERELEMFLVGCAKVGFPRSRQDVMEIVSNKLGHQVSNGWWDNFCRRHPNLTLRVGAPLSKARAMAADPGSLREYFDVLEDTLTKNNLMDKPNLIFNMDESGFPLSPKAIKGIYSCDERHPVTVTSGDKTQITVVACVSAAGYCIPPMIIWDRKNLGHDLTIGEVPGTVYGLSMKGWIDQGLFNEWFIKHFLKYAPSTRPLLLIFDGHSSHYCPETISLAAKQEVLLFTLPPNTTNLTQPLDKGCFGPLKAAWRKACHQFIMAHPGQVVTRYNFATLFNEAWMNSMSVKNITAGFKTTGIVPFNPSALELVSESQEPTLTTSSNLAYIPFYSPCHKCAQRRPFLDLYSANEDDGLEASIMMPEFEEKEGSASVENIVVLAERSKSFMNLQVPSPIYKTKMHQPKKSSRVLTSEENLRLLKEKEKKKTEEAEKKRKKKEEQDKKREENAKKKKKKEEDAKKKDQTEKEADAIVRSKLDCPDFTEEELILFKQRYDNGYDLLHDERYNLWVKLKIIEDTSTGKFN